MFGFWYKKIKSFVLFVRLGHCVTASSPFACTSLYNPPGGLLWQQVASSDEVPLHLCARASRDELRVRIEKHKRAAEGEVCPAQPAKRQISCEACFCQEARSPALREDASSRSCCCCFTQQTKLRTRQITGMESHRWRRPRAARDNQQVSAPPLAAPSPVLCPVCTFHLFICFYWSGHFALSRCETHAPDRKTDSDASTCAESSCGSCTGWRCADGTDEPAV